MQHSDDIPILRGISQTRTSKLIRGATEDPSREPGRLLKYVVLLVRIYQTCYMHKLNLLVVNLQYKNLEQFII